MRDDMSKVIVESPRWGRGLARALEGSRRQFRNRLDGDHESAPQRLGMRRDTKDRKFFGEHLEPLYRYLRQQVNRPWNKIYSELSTQLDRRSVVQAHAFTHINDFVGCDTRWCDGQVFVHTRWGVHPVIESSCELYVHPLTGILLRNRTTKRAVQRREHKRDAKEGAQHPDRRIGLPGMSIDRQWHRVKGIWYEVALCLLEEGSDAAPVYDTVLGHPVSRDSKKVLAATYGYNDVYAWSKRQLSGKTLRQHGLKSQAE